MNLADVVVDRRTMRRDASEHYRQLLGTAPGADIAPYLSRRFVEEDLLFKGHRLCQTAEPRFLTEVQYSALIHKSEAALSLIVRADEMFRARPDQRDRVFGAHPLRGLLDAHLDFLPEPTGRFDALVDAAGDIHFIEYNAGLCGGVYCSDGLERVFGETEPMRLVGQDRPLRAVSTGAASILAMRDFHVRQFGNTLERMALILPDGPGGREWLKQTDVALMIAEMERQGIETRILAVGELDYADGRVGQGPWRADAACIFDWLTLLSQPAAAPIVRRTEVSRTWIVNPLGAAIYRGGKHLFALLSDPASGFDASPEERDWIEAHLPWTRLVHPGPTTGFDGVEADLHDILRRDRAELVLKPCFSMAGRGVVLGWDADDREWQAAIDAAAAEPYVVQRRVVIAKATYACLAADGGLVDRQLEGDLCAFMWADGRAEGVICRLSDGGLMNVSSGSGSIVPVFIAG